MNLTWAWRVRYDGHEMRRLLFNLHLWTAMAAGVFLVILGVTGAIMAFEEPIDHALNPGLWHVTPRGATLPASQILADVRHAFPGKKVAMLMWSKAPNLASMAMVRGVGNTFIDPYTGRILGRRGNNYFTQQVHQLHIRLWAGDTGSHIMGVASIVLIFLTASGLYLWWPLKRVTVAAGKSWRRFNFDLHHAVGFYSSLFLLILSLTGVIMAFSEYTTPALYSMTHSEPAELDTDSTPIEGARPVSPDQAIALGLASLPGTTLVSLMPPNGKEGSWRVGLHFPEDRTPGGRSQVYVDQYSGKVLAVQSSRTAPAGTRLVNLNRALHTGDVGGAPTKLLACLMSLAVAVQAFTGVVMWWKRRTPSQRVTAQRVEQVVR
jgi:uncharacterized iron-regulated membrane protein